MKPSKRIVREMEMGRHKGFVCSETARETIGKILDEQHEEIEKLKNGT